MDKTILNAEMSTLVGKPVIYYGVVYYIYSVSKSSGEQFRRLDLQRVFPPEQFPSLRDIEETKVIRWNGTVKEMANG